MFIVFETLSNLNKTSNRAATHTSYEIDVFYYMSEMHVRPMRFSILFTPTDSSGKTQLMYSTILLCFFVSTYETSRLKYSTVSSNKCWNLYG